MPPSFDPYYKWLGISPEEQPADNYRLLGVRRYEDNLDAIENAADQRMAHLRSLQSGKHNEQAQRILNELSAARVCLLNPGKKATYDAQIRAHYTKQASSSKIGTTTPADDPVSSDARAGNATPNNPSAPPVPHSAPLPRALPLDRQQVSPSLPLR